MKLSIGITMLLSITFGVWCNEHLKSNRYAVQITALQISQCTKADKLTYEITKK